MEGLEYSFVLYDAEKLKQLLLSQKYKQWDDIPITAHRAHSHLANPRRDKDDILLITYENDAQLLGYLGIMPEILYVPQPVKVGWLTCLWVHPTIQGQGIASRLLDKAYALYQKKIILTEYAPETEKLYLKKKYLVIYPQYQGIRWYRKSCFYIILPPKSKIFDRLSPILKWVDNLLNFKYIRIKKNNSFFKMPPHSDISDQNYSTPFNTINKPDNAYLNWIVNNPWVIKVYIKDAERYYFTTYHTDWECRWYVSGYNPENTVYILFSMKGGFMKINYVFYTYEVDLINALKKLIRAADPSIVTISCPPIVDILHHNKVSFSLLSKPIARNYIMSQDVHDIIKKSAGTYYFQDGSGDAAFT